jgi:hypothetical protein
VIVDSSGIVRHASSVTPDGKRDIAALAELCEQVDREHGAGLGDAAAVPGPGQDAVLYVKTGCGFSRAALLARDNLHLQQTIAVKNVSDDVAARDELVALAGKDQAPCLVVGGEAMQDSARIIAYLTRVSTDLSS